MRTLQVDDQVAAFIERILGSGGGGMQTGYKHDATGTPTASGYAHGPGGLLTYPGVDQQVFHTIVGLNGGLIEELPAVPTVYMNPIYMTVTGVQADIGSEKTNICDVPPTGGLLKICRQTAQFGYYERATPEINIQRLGQLENRADPVDLRLANRLQLPPLGGIMSANGGAVGNPLANETDKRLFERAISLHRLLRRQLYTGNPANNLGDGYAEFPGVQKLIGTGHVDAITNQACAAMDSYVVSGGYGDIATNGANYVNLFTNMYHNIQRLAETTGLAPMRGAFVMRTGAFYALTRVWPCAYYTNMCAGAGIFSSSMAAVTPTVDMTTMRDAMYNGRYLMIDGIQVEVILDDAIPESTQTGNANVTGPNCVSSDVYFWPFSVMGGTAVSYLEYFNWDNASINSIMQHMPQALVSVQGPWIETMQQTIWCMKWIAGIKPRLVLLTPQLAGVVQNVEYCPASHERDPMPSDPYFVNGGVTGDGWPDGPSLYASWKS